MFCDGAYCCAAKGCRQGMYTSCLNYGKPEKGHRANGFTTDGGFAEYAINHINTLARVPDTMTDAEATLGVTAGTAMYGLTEPEGLVAGESVVVIGGRGQPASERGSRIRLAPPTFRFFPALSGQPAASAESL